MVQRFTCIVPTIPPAELGANGLAMCARNKTLSPGFRSGVHEVFMRTVAHDKLVMPRRNCAILTEKEVFLPRTEFFSPRKEFFL